MSQRKGPAGLLAGAGFAACMLVASAPLGAEPTRMLAAADPTPLVAQAKRNGKFTPPTAEDIFNMMDADGNGTLDINELPDPDHSTMDANKDGVVDLAEFKSSVRTDPPTPEEVFNMLDTDGDGKLDKTEFPDPGHAHCDANKDGGVDLKEFKKKVKDAPAPGVATPDDIFNFMDGDSNGSLDKNEFPDPAHTDADANKDGVVTLDEFKAHFGNMQPPAPSTPDSEFNKRDANGDGYLDGQEFPANAVKQLDTDGDGKVSLDEWKAAHTPPTPDDIFKKLDKDGSGKISLQEWRDAHTPPKAEDIFKKLDANNDGKLDAKETDPCFVMFADANGDGEVTLDEFKKALPPAPTQQDIDDMFNSMDADGDSQLSLDEFKNGPTAGAMGGMPRRGKGPGGMPPMPPGGGNPPQPPAGGKPPAGGMPPMPPAPPGGGNPPPMPPAPPGGGNPPPMPPPPPGGGGGGGGGGR